MPGVTDDVDKLSLIAEWYEHESALTRVFYLFYFQCDGTLSLFDVNKKRVFLKRTRVDNIEKRDIFVGNTINIYSRHIRITGYANNYTRRIMGSTMQSACVILKPDGRDKMGPILKMILDEGFKLSDLRLLRLPPSFIDKFYHSRSSSSGFPAFISYMSSNPVLALQVINNCGIEKLKQLCGPADPVEAKREAPGSIRALFGTDEQHNAIEYSATPEDAEMESQLLFGTHAPCFNSSTDTVVMKNSTCCIVKPHAIRDGKLGDIIQAIEAEGYNITAMKMFHLDTINAEEFLEIYRGILPEYSDMVNEIVNGGCVAMEIVGPTETTPQDFRNFVGPMDPDIARQLRPNTLRAKFGKTKVQNAVHVTDLPDDAPLEVEYFFKILPT